MKYIRTKDGIYEVHHEDNDSFYVIDKNVPGAYLLVFKELVIKQADTIEDLCDEKVGTFEDGSKPYIYKEASWGDLKKGWTQYHNNIYGAIWTEWGLKYVAKMNDEKGALELL